MTRKRLTPPIGAYGNYTFEEPIATLIGNRVLRCVAIRRTEEIYKSGNDLYADFYSKLGLSKDRLNEDLNVGVLIIGLLDNHGDRFYVPDTFILSYPDQNAITCEYTIIGIDLGPQPTNIPLTPLLAQLKLVAKEFTGIEEELIDVSVNTTPSNKSLTVDEYVNLMDARRIATQNIKPTKLVLEEKNKLVTDMQQQLLTIADSNQRLVIALEKAISERDAAIAELKKIQASNP